MGQTHGSGAQGETGIRHVQGRLKQYGDIFKRIAKLSYKEFVESVEELNRVHVQGRLKQYGDIFKMIAKLSYKEFVESVEELNRVHVQGRLKQYGDIFKRIAKLSYKEFVESVEELNRVHVQGRLKQYGDIFKRIAKLSYKEFVESVEELNRVTASFTDQRGKQLLFSIKSRSDETILWKATVRVECKKVNPTTQIVLSKRDLDLRQYILVYKEITEQVTNLPPATPGGSAGRIDICASMILEEVEHKSLEMEDECCICMQSEAKTILPCTHKFCENCCDEWTDTHNTCPICRANVKSSDESWLLTDAPDSTEYASEVRDVLVSIADRQSRGENT